MKNPLGMKFNLEIGGLGMSTLANAGGKTAEELSDIQHFKESQAQAKMPNQKADSSSSDYSKSEISSVRNEGDQQEMLQQSG
jgi:hypothetical protein